MSQTSNLVIGAKSLIFVDSVKPLPDIKGRKRFSLYEDGDNYCVASCEPKDAAKIKEILALKGSTVIATVREFTDKANNVRLGRFLFKTEDGELWIEKEVKRDLTHRALVAKASELKRVSVSVSDAMAAAGAQSFAG
jgi:hypothetical protein